MQLERIVLDGVGLTVAIETVGIELFNSMEESENFRKMFSSIYRNFPLVLKAIDENGTEHYQGREDIVAYLQNPTLSYFKVQKM